MFYLGQENVESCWQVLDKLVQSSVDQSSDKDMPPIDMNWPLFMSIQASRALILVTARKQGHIIGFAMYYVMRHPHHKTLLIGQCDSLVTHVDERGNRVASRLVEFAEHVLKKRGAKYVIHNQKVPDGIVPLCAKLGYTVEEQSYRKAL